MKRLLLFFAFVAASVLNAFAYSFSAVSPNGHRLYYNINYQNNTVQVTSQNRTSPYYATYPTGNLVIPDSVLYPYGSISIPCDWYR